MDVSREVVKQIFCIVAGFCLCRNRSSYLLAPVLSLGKAGICGRDVGLCAGSYFLAIRETYQLSSSIPTLSNWNC
jgi:hypothetical protein